MEQGIPLSPILLSFLLFLFSTVILRLWKKPKSNHSMANPPPGPWKLPVVGNLHQLVGSATHRALTDLAKKYGPVMQLQIGEVPTVVISSPQAAKEVLKTHELNFLERPNLLVADIMGYNCRDILFSPYGEYWRQMRKVSTLELLSAKRVSSFRSIREEEVSNFIKTIYSKVGSPINLSKMMYDLSIGIITRASIGKKCKNQEAFLPIVVETIEAIGGINIVDVFPSSRLLYMISKLRSRLEKLHQEADMILDDIIDDHRVSKEGTKSTDHHQHEEEDDLLDVLLKLQNQGNFEFHLTTDNIKAIILDVFVGGSDTSATLLEWTVSELLKNPRVMKRAQEEVRQAFSHAQNIDETSLRHLKYMKLVIKEILRLHPPGAIFLRECSNTCKINGYVIKAGTKVMINAWAIGRGSDYWVEAEKFYPERFLDSSIDHKGTDFEYIPFGAGKRMCPGMLFGITNVELQLAQLLYHFDWKLPNRTALEDLDMTETFGGTVRRKNHLNLIPTPYDPSSYPAGMNR